MLSSIQCPSVEFLRTKYLLHLTCQHHSPITLHKMTEYSKLLLTSTSIVLARLTTMFSIKDIQLRCQTGKIKWSLHASERLRKRNISTEDILHCLMHGEIIEEYPDYWLNPAALVFGCKVNGQIIHVVVGLDDFVHIVTAYYPNLEKFEPDLKTRRRP